MEEEIVTESKKIIKGKEKKKEQEEKEKNKRKKERNDINEKKLKQKLEQGYIKTSLLEYTNTNVSDNEIKRFINYLKYFSKDNNSNNSYTNRAFSYHQYITEQYSNFKELDKIMNLKQQ